MVIEVSPDPALKGDKENDFKSFKLEIRDLTWKDRCELNDNMSEETEGGKVTPKFSWWGDFVLKYAKINEEELTRLQNTIRTMDRLTADIGRIEMQKHSVMSNVDQVQLQIQGLREEFMKTYGTDNVNIQTGELAYPNSEENGEVNKED